MTTASIPVRSELLFKSFLHYRDLQLDRAQSPMYHTNSLAILSLFFIKVRQYCNEMKAESGKNRTQLLTPMSDQDRISPYNINTIPSRKVTRIKRNDY